MNHIIRLSILAALLANSLSAHAAIIAYDSASDPAYADGWTDGDNGGYGFQPWRLSDFPEGFFIDSGPLAGNSLGAPAFGMHDPFEYISSASRGFVPLAAGSRFRVNIDGAGFTPGDPARRVSEVVFWDSVSKLERLILWRDPVNCGGNWTIRAGNSFVDTSIAIEHPFQLSLTVTEAGAYDLELAPISGGAPLFSQSGALPVVDGITFLVYDEGAYSSGATAKLFFNDLQISSIPEPATLALGALVGLLALTTYRRK